MVDVIQYVSHNQQLMMDSEKISYKMVLFGSRSSGKGKLIAKMYNKDKYYSNEWAFRQICIGHQTFELRIWDTPSEERYRNKIYLKANDALMFAYNICDSSSFDQMKKIKELNETTKLKILVGYQPLKEENRQVSKQAALKFANNNGMVFQQISEQSMPQQITDFLKKVTQKIYFQDNASKIQECLQFLVQQQDKRQKQQKVATLKKLFQSMKNDKNDLASDLAATKALNAKLEEKINIVANQNSLLKDQKQKAVKNLMKQHESYEKLSFLLDRKQIREVIEIIDLYELELLKQKNEEIEKLSDLGTQLDLMKEQCKCLQAICTVFEDTTSKQINQVLTSAIVQYNKYKLFYCKEETIAFVEQTCMQEGKTSLILTGSVLE